MDEMKIKTNFMRSIFARLIAKGLKKGLGIDLKLNLEYLNVTFDGDHAVINLNANAIMPKSEITKLVDGLDRK